MGKRYICKENSNRIKGLNKMKENRYYMNNIGIYGMMRKSFIIVTKVNKKTFNYQFINDWSIIDNGNKVRLGKPCSVNFRGKLSDKEYFRELENNSFELTDG